MTEFESKKTSSGDDVLTDELSPEEGHEKRLERYAKAKKRSNAVSNYIINEKPELLKIGQEVKECCQYLIYRHFYEVGVYKLVGGCTCKRHLLCMVCAIRRAAKQLQAYLKKVELVLSENPNLKLALITFTVKNGDDLGERYEHIKGSLTKICERAKRVRGGFRTVYTEMQNVSGAVWTYEATKKDKGWHPHVHMLCLVPKDVDLGEMIEQDGKWIKSRQGVFEKALIEEWRYITKDSFILDVRPINEERDRVGAFCEVFKYALKGNDMSVSDQVDAYEYLRGRRLISSLGLLYGVKVPDESTDTIETDLELQPYVDLLYRYSDTFGFQLDKQLEPSELKLAAERFKARTKARSKARQFPAFCLVEE